MQIKHNATHCITLQQMHHELAMQMKHNGLAIYNLVNSSKLTMKLTVEMTNLTMLLNLAIQMNSLNRAA